MMQAPDAAVPVSIASPESPDFRASQDSVHSVVSSTFSAPALASSSSTLSTSTTTETESTAPSSANVESQSKSTVASTPAPAPMPMPEQPAQPSGGGDARAAPRIDTAAAKESPSADTVASPKALESPAAQGSKRSADGSLKTAGVVLEAPASYRPMAAHKRNKSMDTHSGTRIGELSAQLKTRLSYAMVKVQNGWEKQSLEELEESQSQRGSPNSAPARGDSLAFDSPVDMDRRRRPSGVSDISDQMIMSPNSDQTRSHGSTPAYWTPATRPAMHATANLLSITGTQPGHGHGLASVPTFQNGRRRRTTVSHVPPPLLGTGQRKYYSDLSGDMRSPATPRAGILRMPSQQAEKDAVDTLLFMSSPNNSQRFPTGPPEPSPLRTEAPQRRVMFEAYPPQEKHTVYHSAMPAPPHHHQHGPYPAYPAR